MNAPHPIVRPAMPADQEFLSRMFVEAALWRPEWPRVDLEVLLRNPELAAYFSDWGRAGDVALIATLDEVPAGAAWFRLFPADARGYGFVADDIPELGVAVVLAHRGHGIGHTLLRHLQIVATERGHRGLSLSVHPENPARRLYEELGFALVSGNDSAATMVWLCAAG